MITIPGPTAYSSFRVNALIANINAAVNSDAVASIRSVYVHYVNPAQGSEIASDEKKLKILHALLDYDTKPDTSDALTSALLSSIADSSANLPENCYLLRVIPRPGTISPWSSKATNIAQTCGLGNDVERIERGVAILIQANKGVSLDEHIQSGVFMDWLYDRMTQAIPKSAPSSTDLFTKHEPKPLVSIPRNGIEAANKELGLALDPPEIEYLSTAFPERDPTDAELFMFAQVNSEHCRHKIFNSEWKIDGETKPYSLFKMIKNTHEKNPSYTVSAYSDNAAVLEGVDAYFFAPNPKTNAYEINKERVDFLTKVETHNHPTAVSPFAGAATGSGGEIRDEGATGRGSKSKAGLSGYAVSDLLIPGFKQPWELDVGKPNHIASALDIMIDAPLGSAAFNNEFGRPCISGYFRTLTTKVINEAGKEEVRGFHKPIMIAGGIGSIRPQFALKNHGITPGAALIVLGGPAMLIGLGGGAASSIASGEGSVELDFASVQRGNPEMQRRAQMVIDACVALDGENPIQSIHDVGAGGLSNALTELVHDNNLGAIFELRDIPNVEPGMSPMEIWCCEAQERYVLAVSPENLDGFKAICERERAVYGVVGVATAEEKLILNDRLMGTTPIDIEMSVLFGKTPRMSRVATTAPLNLPKFDSSLKSYGGDFQSSVDRVLHLPAVGSKSFLITIGDRSVTGLVAQEQMVGPWQVPVADVAITLSSHGANVKTGEAFTTGEKPTLALISAAASAKMSVAESLLNLYAADVTSLDRIRLSANWMSPASHAGEGAKLYEAVQAIGLDLCPALNIAIPVGKDSMSMKMKWKDNEVTAPLSVVITAFSSVNDVSKTWTPQLQRIEGGSKLVLVDLSLGKARLGGSAIAQVYGQVGNEAPNVDDAVLLKNFLLSLEKLHQDDNIVLAYHDRSDGGLFTTAAEMAFAGRVGVEMNLESKNDAISALFNEELGAVFQVRDEDVAKFAQILTSSGVPQGAISTVGTVLSAKDQSFRVNFNGEAIYSSTRGALQSAWAETSYQMQKRRDNPAFADQEFEALSDDADPGIQYKLSYPHGQEADLITQLALQSKPRVAILREQGVNGHVEMAYSMALAGFTPVDVHMSDIVSKRVTLNDFVGFAACGGFSYGDVLGAGNGWAKSVLLNSEVRDEFYNFFNNRNDTFALGVCNGCQFLSRLQEIIPGADSWPTFERNASEQYEGRTEMVEVVDTSADESTVPCIFTTEMGGSQLPIAVAHGEGRATFASEEKKSKFLAKNLIAFKYVDNYGNVTQRYPFNPNGSPAGIAGIRNDNGRVMAMMPHPERVTIGVSNSHWVGKETGWTEGPWVRLFRNARKWVN
ncbi:phosphoribosylformylglycinamidin [Nadsonia fulvescens var. elongata DSM 6958]|uniref:Phosphoribosylformylglycinamidine synthase n=2 Tax=Nadsonia fulvescens TaxID=45786 RepID=A0A1E3PM19_9ASCO|nr:phosphoribosylformylglycinamidin [Nadsonia fulvescens var. elongata DSM 6958]